MENLKVSSAVAAIAIFFAVTIAFIVFGDNVNEAKNIENRSGQQQIMGRITVSRGSYTRNFEKPEPKAEPETKPEPKPEPKQQAITFNGPNVPKHSAYIDEKIIYYAKENGIDPFLLAGMVMKESSFDPDVQGGNGFGLTQMEEASCKEMGVEYPCTDICTNLWAGSGYYKKQLDRFGNERIALAAYNCGPTFVAELVEKYGNSYEAIKPHLPGITREHVFEVFRYRDMFKELNRQ